MLLRALTPGDADEFTRVLAASKKAWAPWMPSAPAPSSDADVFEQELERATHGREAGTHLRLAGFLADGGLAGLFSLNEIVRGPFESAYAGWSVSADRMGQGLGTEGVRALLDVAFARRVLSTTPLVDGHNDLPWAIRTTRPRRTTSPAYDLRTRTPGHTDIARCAQGMVGAQFWSVYIPFARRRGGRREGAARADRHRAPGHPPLPRRLRARAHRR
jgi:hypothetical protein